MTNRASGDEQQTNVSADIGMESRRGLVNYLRVLKGLPEYFGYLVGALRAFKRPLVVLRHYVKRTAPAGKQLRLRDGTTVFLSDHPHDIITAFVVFAKGEYGALPRGGTVIDIGANIGTFALWAAREGAARVLAYEPDAHSFATLRRNAEGNGLEKVIVPHQLAVSDEDGGVLRLSTGHGPYNAVYKEDGGDFTEVPTTTLERICSVHNVDRIDVLKLDCEGGEYDILYNLPDEVFAKIHDLRMEYHRAGTDELIALMQRHGLRVTLFKQFTSQSGNLWFTRE